MSGDPLLVLLLGITLISAVFLAAAETALIRVSKFRIQALAEGGSGRARRLADLLDRLPAVLNLILLLALLAQIGAATITGIMADRRFGSLGVTMASVVLTLVLFIYGEAIPKTFAVHNAERTALVIARPIAFLERLLRPIVSLLVWVADIQMPGKGITTSPTVTEGELRLLASTAAHEGEIAHHDRELIERAFRFGDRRVDDIMVPRPDIVAVTADATVDEAIELALESGHRRLPVHDGTVENIVGVVRLRDLVANRHEGSRTVDSVAEPPLVVPESKKVVELLRDMQEHQTHLVVVVDEYGGTAGLVTVEDVAEELLGTISEQPDEPDVKHLAPGRWIVKGSIPVEDLGRLGMQVPEGDWNTGAGLMMGVAGRVLKPGDHVDIEDYRLVVLDAKRRRITRISIELASGSDGDSE